MEKEEIFKPIPDFDGYEISNYGSIRSYQRRTVKILKPKIDKDGYHNIQLIRDGKRFHLRVHRLVFITFIGSIEENYQINHKDGVKQNNFIENLEQVNSHDNILHSRHTLQKKQRGVVWHKNKEKWMATIYINKQQKHLGYFENKEDGLKAYFDKYVEVYGKQPW